MREALLEIARSGVLAPSADNQHVFRIEMGDSCVRLWPSDEFLANTARHRHVLGLISLGATVENMRLRATEFGLVGHAHWLAFSETGPIVQLDLLPTQNENRDGLAAAIPMRRTNRRMYRGPGLSMDEMMRLNSAVTAVEGVQIVWLTGAARKRALGLIWRAESERFLRRELHKEIFSSIRFDLSWHETADWALPPGSLEIEPPMRPLFKALRHWALMRPLTWVGGHHLIGLRAGWFPCWQAPALGLLATSLPVEQGATAVGAALERLWLSSTQMGLAMQPLAASAVLPLQSSSDKGCSDKLRSYLAKGWKTICPEHMPLMVFRVGRADLPKVSSGRKSIEDYLMAPKSN